MEATIRIGIIGGGLVGLGTAYRLLEKAPNAQVTVFEKEESPGRHQSTHNSGVLHCGLYYKPGSLKAKLAVNGLQQMVEFCQHHKIQHEICGKLVVATNEAEVAQLSNLYERGIQNGLVGLKILDSAAAREIEPHVRCLQALQVPQEGIVDYGAVCTALVSEITRIGGVFAPRSKVVSIGREKKGWRLEFADGEPRQVDVIINCGGLYSDRICQMAGRQRTARIVPFRGEYYKIVEKRQELVRNLVYPVPDPSFPFLGVHYTRLIGGGIECGPNAVLATAREGYSLTDFVLADFVDTISYPGFWKFFGKHSRMCLKEIGLSLSKAAFCRSLQKMLPEIREDDLEACGTAGVRAQAMYPNGTLVQDFEIVAGDADIHVINAPSPAATASLAIGETVASKALALLC